MLTIPERWHPSCSEEPRIPFLSLPGASLQLEDPVQVAEQLAQLLPVRSCDAVEKSGRGRPFRCHLGGLQLEQLTLVALWGSGLRGEVEGTPQASFILPYRGSGQFRLEGRSLANIAGRTLLYLPPGPWRTTNDAMGGITIRLDPQLLRQVGRSMAGPQGCSAQWQAIGHQPRMLPLDQATNLALIERLYWLMGFIHSLVLRHGAVAPLLRLDDLLLRQIVAVLAPALLAEPAHPEPEPSIRAVDALIDWMHAHCHQAISLSDLEQRSHYSRRSLQYAFKRRFGCGPMQYLRRLRLWRARRRLQQADPQTNLTSVALACGYLDLPTFSRDFRRIFGVAPSSLLPSRGGQAGGNRIHSPWR
jgi:AraC-like DNA-binding protein